MIMISGIKGMMMMPLGMTLLGMYGSGTSFLSGGPFGKHASSAGFMSNNGFSMFLKKSIIGCAGGAISMHNSAVNQNGGNVPGWHHHHHSPQASDQQKHHQHCQFHHGGTQ